MATKRKRQIGGKKRIKARYPDICLDILLLLSFLLYIYVIIYKIENKNGMISRELITHARPIATKDLFTYPLFRYLSIYLSTYISMYISYYLTRRSLKDVADASISRISRNITPTFGKGRGRRNNGRYIYGTYP